MRPFRILIVDDDPTARAHLERLLQALGQDQVETAENAYALLDRIRDSPPEVVFLDIRMPGLSGLDALRALNALPQRPRVVLVSAFDEHALEAFEAAAFDYLLKPVDPDRLRRTLERLAAEPAQGLPSRLALPTADRVVLLDPDQILYVQAQGDLIRVVTRDGTYEARTTLREVARRLPPTRFLRVHRSYLVNLDHVVELHPFFSGTMLLRLDDPHRTEIPVSRSAARFLKALLQL
ncbi:MAG: LytTR family DNA-binding domain-containing protein [Armatimonadetes bacterium]|nr:LytTR family DNA-binding domain-containing protein [Armatimonadota bacterium]MDW8152981.1 LytTR family DNA-binding domain-containing protein [Armatimonadota bacterium]